MPKVVVDISDELAACWTKLAEEVSVSVETWLSLCGFWAGTLELPITRIVLRQPPAASAAKGVAWEVGEFPLLTCPPRPSQGATPMINKVILVGNLGRAPEIRSTASGMPVATLSIATNRKWKDRDGNPREQTEWHRVVVFGRQAEIAGQYLSSGRQIYLEGRMQTRSWEDRQTAETKYSTEVVCEYFQMLGQPGAAHTKSPSAASHVPASSDHTVIG